MNISHSPEWEVVTAAKTKRRQDLLSDLQKSTFFGDGVYLPPLVVYLKACWVLTRVHYGFWPTPTTCWSSWSSGIVISTGEWKSPWKHHPPQAFPLQPGGLDELMPAWQRVYEFSRPKSLECTRSISKGDFTWYHWSVSRPSEIDPLSILLIYIDKSPHIVWSGSIWIHIAKGNPALARFLQASALLGFYTSTKELSFSLQNPENDLRL